MEILKKHSFFIIIAVLVVGFLLFTGGKDSKDTTDFTAVSSASEDSSAESSLTESEEAPAETVTMVDVKGAVVSPGVYEVDPSSRVNDVIKLAGGFTEKAAKSQVNLAQKVQDEMIIQIPEQGDPQQAGTATIAGSGKIRINYAEQAEIEELNGIGPSKAAAIIQHREEHGLFQAAEDLLDVPGIGEKTLENLREDIQVP
ncbi:helix-hairpin-helix domain-containing protein [Lentibacillus sediminis]|uniref:helix-hairpin-helix domain-containing protein n=1 Tax=Lentibacillus sediminis TaxID=1940529 RepID=UPI001EFCF950|nr:helix-hairpin-helix domain-containing protein [Lentibacillus sediminis]